MPYPLYYCFGPACHLADVIAMRIPQEKCSPHLCETRHSSAGAQVCLSFSKCISFWFLRQIWKHESCWVHYTEFLDKQDTHHSILYNYRVNWSIPTAQIPIPKIETTMDFTIKFSKSKPPVNPFLEAWYSWGKEKALNMVGAPLWPVALR